MTNYPRVSVLIPTYNYAHFLDETIRSVLEQTYQDYELIIVDNASTDDTEAVVANYLHDKRISYYRNPHNLGHIGNWNKCLGYAKGEFLKFLCADDKFRPELLEKYVGKMDQYPSVSMVACNKMVFGKDFNYPVTITLEHLQTGHDMNFHMLYGFQGVGEPTSVMFRRREFEKIGYFSQTYQQFVDFDYWLKLLSLGDCYLIPEILVDIRSHPGTVSHQVKKQRKFLTSFELYTISKAVQQNEYDIVTAGTRIDDVVRKYAMDCVRNAIFRNVNHLHRKQNRAAFREASAIAIKENLLPGVLHEFSKGIMRKLQRIVRKPQSTSSSIKIN